MDWSLVPPAASAPNASVPTWVSECVMVASEDR